VVNGLKPACAKACPSGAISFGEREEILQIARTRQQALSKGNPGDTPRIYGEKELDGLGVMYLLPERASLYGLPEKPRMPIEKVIFKWIIGIIPGIAVFYGLWRYFTKDKSVEGVKSEGGK
jgi:formate dehydrogenase iron-sulfur subunit